MGDKKTLLVVLAHPDDETFGMGGTLALYARQGVDVHLICATRGEVGEVDPEFLQGYSSIAELREHELRCAAQHLGLKGVHFLDYRDSGMPGTADNEHPQALVVAPVEEVSQKIVRYIRELRPQVVLTFDPIGGYRHPDHIAMHLATVQAFRDAGNPECYPNGLPPYAPQKLYYHVMPHVILRLAVRLMPLFGRDPRKFGKNQDIDLMSIAETRFPVHARVDYRSVSKIRDIASACHASQGGGRLMGGPLGYLRKWMAYESYMRAYPEPQPGAALERDLFAGVQID